MRTTFAIFLIVLSFEIPSQAQITQESYFPLDVGNAWTFADLNTVAVDHSFELEGEEWVVLVESCDCLPILFGDTLRTDVSGNVWQLEDGEPQLLFKFSETDTSDYQITTEFVPDNPPETFNIRVSRPDSINVSGSVFRDVVRLYFTIPGARDSEIDFLFARGIGLVKQSNIWFGTELREARIGERITSVTVDSKPEVPITLSANVYPNPLFGTGFFTIEGVGQLEYRPIVYDVLGRAVQVLTPRSCSSSSCTYQIDASRLTAGNHFVVFREGKESRVTNFIVLDE